MQESLYRSRIDLGVFNNDMLNIVHKLKVQIQASKFIFYTKGTNRMMQSTSTIAFHVYFLDKMTLNIIQIKIHVCYFKL
jgi:hypothetical protein